MPRVEQIPNFDVVAAGQERAIVMEGRAHTNHTQYKRCFGGKSLQTVEQAGKQNYMKACWQIVLGDGSGPRK